MNRVVLTNRIGPWLSIRLNRPEHLNAVDNAVAQYGIYDLVRGIVGTDIKAVLAGGTGRAVAAGGDVRGMVHDVTCGEPINAEYYLRNEYQFYYLMNTLPVMSVTLMPQIVMGGGLGFCHSTTFRIASEKTRMAMPETKIGLFPDVGGGYFMNRMETIIPGSARWLGFGARHIWGKTTVQTGLATHFVPFERHQKLENELVHLNFSSEEEIRELIESFAEPVNRMQNEDIDKIEIYKEEDSLEDILEKLFERASDEEIKMLNSVCPVSVAVADQHIRMTNGKSLKEVLELEFRAMRFQQRDENFFEGVRALLVDKDNNPKFNPASLTDLLAERKNQSNEEYFEYYHFQSTELQDNILNNDYVTEELDLVSWDEILKDPNVIAHRFPAEYRPTE